MSLSSATKKIEVAIWYKDVNQNQIDTLTKQRIGYDVDSVALDYEMPSPILIDKLKNDDPKAEAEMKEYLEFTSKQRQAEKQRTDNYIQTRREISRGKYNEKSSQIINEIDLSSNDIIFNSQYAPMIIAKLTKEEIEKFSKDERIEDISYYEEEEHIECTEESVLGTTGVNDIRSLAEQGLYGTDIKVGLLEKFCVRLSELEDLRYIVPDNETPAVRYTSNNVKMTDYGNVVIVGDEIQTGIDDDGNQISAHADAVADTLLTFAPGITIYSCDHTRQNIEGMLTEGVTLIHCGTGGSVYESKSNYAYTNSDKWYDHLVSNHNVTVVAPAGNYGEHDTDYYGVNAKGETVLYHGARVFYPASAYNVIGVGAYSDANTENHTDDFLKSNSNYKNSVTNSYGTINGCEKPDVIMPANLNGGGTSNAAPMLSATIALMLELKPSLAATPQAIKAIVLASCHRKVAASTNGEPAESIYSGITDRQGAGAPDAWTMAAIVSQGTYGVGTVNDVETQDTIHIKQPSYGASNLNVSISWLKENYASTADSHYVDSMITEGENINLDLSVYRNNVQAGSSTLEHSSTEMVYIPLSSSANDYEIRINQLNSIDSVVRYGYAYSTDNAYMAPVASDGVGEGICYIKNENTNTYLTYNATTEQIVLQSFTGADAQKWILRGNGNTGYRIYPAYASVEGMLNIGDAYNSTNSYAVLGSGNLNLSIKSKQDLDILSDGAVAIYSSDETGHSILRGSNSTVSFYSQSGLGYMTEKNMWQLEKVNYRRGDANMDGVLAVDDATLVQSYCANQVSFNNMQKFLADADRDGLISVKDHSYISKIVAGIYIY